MKNQVIIILFTFILASCAPAMIPTRTETPISTATALLTPPPTPTLTSTLTSVALQTTERIEFSMLSPDGTKKIQTKDWLTFEILNTTDELVVGSFTYDRAKFGQGDMYLWEAGYAPIYWSQNGKYIYVKALQAWDGGGKYFGNVFGAAQGLARFDVDTGVMTEILTEKYGPGGYTFAISPDESGIIYVDQLETPLVLRWRELSTNKEKILHTFDENIFDVGGYGWSPKSDRLVFSTLEIPNPDQQWPEFLYDYFVLDLRNLQQHMILQGFDHWLHFESWSGQNQVFFTDGQDTVWQLDLESDIFSAIGTATPSP